MCRKNHLLGCTVAAFGLGLVVGHCAESAFFSIWGGTFLIVLGFCLLSGRTRF